MTQRHFSILLIGAVVAALAVALLVPRKLSDNGVPELGLLLPGVDQRINAARAVRIQGAGGAAVTLSLQGERWEIAELEGFPADWTRLRQLLADLAQARIVELKTDNPAYYDRLGVQDPEPGAGGLLVQLDLQDAAPALIVGNPASGRDGQYVRRMGEARSFLIDRELELTAEPVEWADRDIADVPSGEVAEVEIIHPDGDWVLVRKRSVADSDFVLENLPEGRAVTSSWTVNSLGGVLAALRMDSVQPAADAGAPQETVRLRLLTFAGLEYTAQAWQDEAGHWLTLAASVPVTEAAAGDADEEAARRLADEATAFNQRVGGWWFRIPEYKFGNLTKRLEQLLQPLDEGSGDDA